jgi:hypothetical protein
VISGEGFATASHRCVLHVARSFYMFLIIHQLSLSASAQTSPLHLPGNRKNKQVSTGSMPRASNITKRTRISRTFNIEEI